LNKMDSLKDEINRNGRNLADCDAGTKALIMTLSQETRKARRASSPS